MNNLEPYKLAFEHWIMLHPTLTGFIVFSLTFFESLAVIGIILPGVVLMTTVGTLVGAHFLPITSTLSWAIAGAVLGDALSYFIGYYYKSRLRDIWPFSTHPNWVQSCERFFASHGGKSVFFGRLGPLRAFIPIVAGMLHMRPIAFFAANIPSSIMWAPAYMLPGILLGMTALQFPPDMTTHFLTILFIALLILWLSGWLIKRIIYWCLHKLDGVLDHVWEYCQHHRYFHPVYTALQDPYHPQRHGQLTSACVLLVLVILLALLGYMVSQQIGLIYLNHPLHFFSRSWYSPWGMKIAIVLTTFGDKLVVLPMLVTVAIYLFCKRHTYSAWHWLSAGILASGMIACLKWLTQSPRPNDLSGTLSEFSFPSGHTTLSIVIWGFFAVMLARASKPQYRWLSHFIAVLIIILVAISRLYLGAHWFTDIIGGALLGTCCLLLITISYRRLLTKALDLTGLLTTCLISFILFSSIYLFLVWNKQVELYLPNSPTLLIDQQAWWHNQVQNIPFFRPNRFGNTVQLLNIQWRGNPNVLRNTLRAHGWEDIDDSSLQSTLQRLATKPIKRKLPLLPATYFNHQPILTMVKPTRHHHTLLVLHLWDPNILFTHSQQPLYLGAVNYFTPHTQYLWQTDLSIDTSHPTDTNR